jgi:enamine deaminase RidA (YjgF/YER057c/UK114 family)
MPDNIRFSNPDTMQKPPGYSHVVEVTGPGRTVYFAGQLGIDKSGKMGANAREQMEIAFENIKAALTSVGASFENVVKFNNYIIDIGTNIAHYREIRDKYVNTAAPPASTTIGVPQLARGRLVRGRGDRGIAAEVTMRARFDPPTGPTNPQAREPKVRPFRRQAHTFETTHGRAATAKVLFLAPAHDVFRCVARDPNE